jgi:hypothetical protein
LQLNYERGVGRLCNGGGERMFGHGRC